MNGKLNLSLKFDQRLSMNQQLSQAISFMQCSTLELKQLIKQFLETSVLLEVDECDTQNESLDEFADQEENSEYQDNIEYMANKPIKNLNNFEYSKADYLENVANPVTLQEHLLRQTCLCKFNEKQQEIAENIIYIIDEDGYLRLTPYEIYESIQIENVTPQDIEMVLKYIKTFEPTGIAAYDLNESLLTQLSAVDAPLNIIEVAKKIISEHFDLLSKTKHRQIREKMHIDEHLFSEALKIIKTLTPKPGLKYSSEVNYHIEPEIIVKKQSNKWCVSLADSFFTRLNINNKYRELIQNNRGDKSFNALTKELQEAQWLIKSIEHRNQTLLSVASYIVKKQEDFFNFGKSHLKPLNISEVSAELDKHESTISRITTGKYLTCPSGIFELKYFFPSCVKSGESDICSDTAVKEKMKEIIANEKAGHVLSDDDIARILNESGIHIARRTVAKYRIALKILPSYQRQHMKTEEESLAT